MTAVLRRGGKILKPAPDYVLPDMHSLCFPISSIELDPDNANTHPDWQIEELRLDLREYRQHKPLVCQPKGERLICRIGNGTLRAARLEGWEYIAIVRADSDDDIRAMARAIRDNTASWGSRFDEEELRSQLRRIDAHDSRMAGRLGWDADTLESMLSPSIKASDLDRITFSDPGQPLTSGTFEPREDTAREDDVARIKSSGSNEWYTPADIVTSARAVMGSIDVDPASCAEANRSVRAGIFYDEAADGFAREWEGNVWLNPPYGFGPNNVSNAQRWSHRLIDQYEDGIVDQACLLVNASTGYAWFKRLWDYPICFFYNRIAFEPPEGSANAHRPTHSNIVAYFGENVDRFVSEFSKWGRVVVPADDRAHSYGDQDA